MYVMESELSEFWPDIGIDLLDLELLLRQLEWQFTF